MIWEKLATVEKWNRTPAPNEKTCLEYAFSAALVSDQNDFFSSVYIPVKIPTASGMPEDYTYTNIGLTASEISKIYADFFGMLKLIEPLKKTESEPFDFITSCGKLGNRIKSVLWMNRGKYLKMIELEGFVYNPLWNVDGVEIFSYLENSGEDDETTTTAEDRLTYSDVNQTTTVQKNLYDGSLNNAEKTTIEQNPNVTAGVPANNYTRSKADAEGNVVTREHVHKNAENNGTDYTVSAEDNAFGEAITGGNKYHTDKRIRQGNIGVTATQDLIQKSRDALRFSIIAEFFRDINEQILCGLYNI